MATSLSNETCTTNSKAHLLLETISSSTTNSSLKSSLNSQYINPLSEDQSEDKGEAQGGRASGGGKACKSGGRSKGRNSSSRISPNDNDAHNQKGSSKSNRNTSKNRGESPYHSSQQQHSGRSNGYHYQQSQLQQQQQSSLIQNAGLAYPFLYPNSYHLAGGFQSNPSAGSASQSRGPSGNSGGNSTVSASSGSQSQCNNSSSGQSSIRRGGKKKTPATQVQHPELRLFFNLRRRDSAIHKGQSHVYKPKNPPLIQEWYLSFSLVIKYHRFKRLSVEERINCLSTVCPHLTETFLNMYQRMDINGQSSFARIGPHNTQDHKYFTSSSSYHPHHQYSHHGYPGFGHFFSHQNSSSNNSQITQSDISFEEMFYHRSSSETEYMSIRNSERAKIEAENEIIKHVLITDYFGYQDTLTVSEEIVQDPDNFLKLMATATNNQAFSSCCHFEVKPNSSNTTQLSNQINTVIEQPAWFKPKSFHTFATWVIVALEENLWAHYNFDNSANMSSSAKVNDLASMFREKADIGSQDVELLQLASYWRETTDKHKSSLIDQLRTQVAKEMESESNNQAGSVVKTNKVVQSKNLSYSVQIKDKLTPTIQTGISEQVDEELRPLIDLALAPGFEVTLMKQLIFTNFDKACHRPWIVSHNRKFLELIKKKFKDDLMDNLLQEEYSKGVGQGAAQGAQKQEQQKMIKKKKKKNTTQSNANNPEQHHQQEGEENTLDEDKKKKKKPIQEQMMTTVIAQNSKHRKQKKKSQQTSNTMNEKSQPVYEQIAKTTCESGITSSDDKVSQSMEDTSNFESDHKPNQSNNNNNAADNKKQQSKQRKTPQQQANKVKFNQYIESGEKRQKFYQSAKTTSSSSKTSTPPVEGVNHFNKQDPVGHHLNKLDQNIELMKEISEETVLKVDDRKNSTSRERPDEQELLNIKNFLVELTNQLVNEVCKRAEASKSPSRNPEESKSSIQNMEGGLPAFSNLEDPQNLNKDELDCNKKEQKQARKDESEENNSQRKRSFNYQQNAPYMAHRRQQPKDEKRFTEDLNQKLGAVGNVNQFNQFSSATQTNGEQPSNPQNLSYQLEAALSEGGVRKYSNTDTNSQKSSHRKGFGINLKPNDRLSHDEHKITVAAGLIVPQPTQRKDQNQPQSEQAWAKGTIRQPEKQLMKNKKPPQAPSNKKQDDEQNPQTMRARKNSDQSTNSSQLQGPKHQDESIPVKKKRNKKKSKLTDTDIMNQFMKSLHSHAEETNIQHDQKHNKPNTNQKKKLQEKKVEITLDKTDEIQNQIETIQNENNEEAKKQQKSNFGGRPRQGEKIRQNNQRRYTEDEQIHQQINESANQSQDNQSQKSQKKNNQRNLKGHKINRPPQRIINNQEISVAKSESQIQITEDNIPQTTEKVTEDNEQVEMVFDETPAEKQLNLNSTPFRVNVAAGIVEQSETDSSINGAKDTTTLTITQNCGDTSIEFNEGGKSQSFQNTPSKTMSCNSKIFTKSSQQTQSNKIDSATNFTIFQPSPTTNQDDPQDSSGAKQNFRTPPQSSKKQTTQNNNYFNPSNFSQANSMSDPFAAMIQQQNKKPYPFVHQHSSSSSSKQDFFPSFEGTPFMPQPAPTLQSTFSGHPYFPSPFQQTQQFEFNPYYASSCSGGKLSPSNFGQQETKVPWQKQQHQQRNNNNNYKYNKHQQQRPNAARNLSGVYMQPMNLSQSMQEQQQQYMQTFANSENNNIYFQDQANITPMSDNYSQKVMPLNDPVFPYVEKQNMTLPCYSPSSQQQQQQVPLMNGYQGEVLQNPFSYQRPSAPQYFDQSQELIFQIFNSIKSNHSMSPIPQMMSPPPVLDFQMSMSSDISYQPQRIDSATFNQQESNFYGMLDNDINVFVDQVQQSISLMQPERDFVLAKISEIAAKAFVGENPKLVLFGSLITGLALESSDMDLAVTGLHIDDRFVMITDLNKLANALKDWQCISSFKSIDTASIPVIKMKVDLVKLRQVEMQEREEGDFAQREIPENQRYLSVDITFDDSPIHHNNPYQQSLVMSPNGELVDPSMQTKTHLGLQSCALVQFYIANYKNLKQVSILLKRFLALHSFNIPYNGGLSSYSTVILLVAYMNYYGLKNGVSDGDMSPSRLLLGFLDFYGNYFNPGSMGISVYEDGSFFQVSTSMEASNNFVILDPLNLQNNTTKNSYLTKEILFRFQSAFNSLKSLMHKLPSLQKAVVSSQTALSRANSQDQKSSSIPFENTSNEMKENASANGILIVQQQQQDGPAALEESKAVRANVEVVMVGSDEAGVLKKNIGSNVIGNLNQQDLRQESPQSAIQLSGGTPPNEQEAFVVQTEVAYTPMCTSDNVAEACKSNCLNRTNFPTPLLDIFFAKDASTIAELTERLTNRSGELHQPVKKIEEAWKQISLKESALLE